MRLYHYAGPDGVAQSVMDCTAGVSIQTIDDVARWISDTQQKPDADGTVMATFVVDEMGTLRIADRRSEHVACAGGGPVLAAGEITFGRIGKSWEVLALTNQSAGYCPEPQSWQAASIALKAAKLNYGGPDRFEPAFEFRRCPCCAAINLVHDGLFECSLCGAGLTAHWNFAER
jgi:hypothetical protein